MILSNSTLSASVKFLSARPVWLAGREKEMNRLAGFRAVFESPAGQQTILRIAASTLYRVFLDGEFLGYGPVRAPHGMFRVDEWLLPVPTPGRHALLAVEVSSYNINTYYQLHQPPFLQAEVVVADRVIASTGGEGVLFAGKILAERVQRVERYSVARGFSEIYRLHQGFDQWRHDPSASFDGEELCLVPQGRLLQRRIPYPRFTIRRHQQMVSHGSIRPFEPESIRRDWTLTYIGPDLLGYKEEELDAAPSIDIQKMQFVPDAAMPVPGEMPLELDKDTYRTVDFGTNRSGFIGLSTRSRTAVSLYAVFDEVLTNGDVDPFRLRCVNILRCDLEPGEISFESFEPYTFRYLKLFVKGGGCEIQNIYLREYTSPEGENAIFRADDDRLNRIFDAGRETVRQNTVDLLTDCPSRERAGWLCDSFFLGRTTALLYGNVLHEKNFLENYLLPVAFRHIPPGMLPMCFPADHDNGNFIPNWALWFILELEEYVDRSEDRALADALRERVMQLLEYFRRFENQDGLLEKLKGWIFVEWSKANDFVQDVNYPTNMLYVGALRAAGRLYDAPALLVKAERVAGEVLRQSFDGELFVDNAVRCGEALVRTDNRTEACQYYAFYFNIALPDSHEVLWKKLVGEFGVGRGDLLERTGIHPANALLGLPLRFELLSRYGEVRSLVKEAIALYEPMALRTGTLWEHVGPTASCCHGFASHIAYVFYRDILGLHRIDARRKEVQVTLHDSGIQNCSGVVPVAEGSIGISWQVVQGTIFLWAALPAGYTATVENRSQWKLVRMS